MISVVIPLYNKESFIAEAIQSVLQQTFTQWELLIVNDASTDNSVAFAKQSKDSRIRIIHIEKSGVSVARNVGIANASFSWIALLDADDWWDSTFLEEMARGIKEYPNQQLFASGRTHVFPAFSKRYNNIFLPKEGHTAIVNYFEVLQSYLPLINSSNAVIERSLFAEVGLFKEHQKLHEDHDLWIRLCLGREVVFVNKNLSFYRNTEANSASKLPYEANDFCIFLHTLLEQKGKFSNPERKYFKKYCNRFVLLTYIKNYARYTTKEDNEVYLLAKKLVTPSHRLILKFLHWLPFKGTYPMFKVFQLK
ncbi:glycosyltransferase involved in cell wall biosynthesis [Ulvibacter sp. MAR_2010_11]|uniref:glycosyltransferase family 2 protein n=1 Tax=Ulvibacter sp. MAR_2010_11 TaxID=1250229 RepID=UPI000C2CD5D8|nr:glycosyltransferase family A protein [Ulvibacter sp. MAR_2010_11]PKA84359.1 glycosyltransferase involved in cell wall biosynthesis [Ulvibacter sp. MAR_2010_11]